MIQLTKLNKEPIVINSHHIECVESIPESKVIMMSGRFYIVEENVQEIIDKVVTYMAHEIATSRVLEGKFKREGNMEA